MRHFPAAVLGMALSLSLGCASAPKKAVLGSARAVPNRIVAQIDSRRIAIGSEPVVVLDFREDWDGGSGGTLMTARIAGGKLWVTTNQVSRGPRGRGETTTDEKEFGLAGFRKATVKTPGGTVVFNADP